MIVIAVDTHKRSHTLVAVDEAGRKLAEKAVPVHARRSSRRRRLDGTLAGAHLRDRGLPSSNPTPGGRSAAGR